MATINYAEAPRVTSSTLNAHGQRVYVVTSRSHEGAQLWLVAGNVCQCKGFAYRGHCAHLDAVHAQEQSLNMVAFHQYLLALLVAGYRAECAEAARAEAHEWLWDNCSSWL